MQEITFYCRNCKKSMRMSYELTGNDDVPVLNGITIRCHTHKCIRVAVLKKYTEGILKARADAQNRVYL